MLAIMTVHRGVLLLLLLQFFTGIKSDVAPLCGSTVCPSGMDCISINGTLQCADPCQVYTELNDEWRSTNNTSTQNPHCDRDVNWQGWYRVFLGQTSAHIPERCVARLRCGTQAPLWITTPHPTQSGQIVNRTVCSSWSNGCCSFPSHTIHVKLCYGNYYVYKLVQPSHCTLAYCAEVNGTAPEDSSTTPDPSTATSASNQVTADITDPPESNSTVGPTTPDPRPGNITTAQVTADITSTTTPDTSSTVEDGPLPDNSSAVEGDVRLNGKHSCSGRVEIFHRGVWRTVCNDLIIRFDANLLCRQLDCGPGIYTVFSPVSFLQDAESVSFVEVECSNDNNSITECRRMELGVHKCSSFIGVTCEDPPQSNSTVGPTTPDPRPGNITTAQVTADITSTTTADTSSTVEAAAPVRLVNSNDRCSGRVELYHGGRWGTVCDDGWDLREANVVCRQMDCGSARSALQNAAFGRGSGPIWLDNVLCTGSESKLEECRHRGFGSHNCGHNEDASVICEASTLHNYQLICSPDKLQMGLDLADLNSGLNPYSGHLASHNCSWARVQNNMVWYDVDAVEGACGNTLTTNSTHAIYSNTLFVQPVINGSFFPVSIPFSCAYPLETDTSLNVAIRPVLPILGSGAKPRATMSLFRNSACTETYPAGVVNMPLGSPLYVGVSVTKRDFRFVVVLEECYASHSPDPHYYQKHYLIQNKCPTDARQVSVTESGRSLRARFSALLFLLEDDYRPIYLHCNISLCDRTRFFCVPSCQRRTYRSVSSSEAAGSVTVGPITWDKSTK